MDISTINAFFDSCPALLFIADKDGSLLRCSRALTRRFGDVLGDAPSLRSLAPEAPELAGLLDALADAEVDEEATCTLRMSEGQGAPHDLRCTARRGSDGNIHGQLEVLAKSLDEQIEHALLGAIMRSLDIVLWAIDETGKFVFHDGKGLAAAGLQPGQLLGMDIFELYPAESISTVRDTLAGKASFDKTEAHGVHWETWNIPLQIAEGTTYCAGLSLNVTERLTNEASLQQQLETIRDQQRAIHELSAPVLNVWDDVLTVPLVGAIDSQRTDELTDRLLAAVHRQKTRFAIIDLTGVDAIDTSMAGHVSRLLRSLRLLGVEGLVTGVSPEVAQTMAGVGIDFEDIKTHRTLREALRHCMRVQGR